MLNATVTAQSRLQTPEQFRNIIVKTEPERRERAARATSRGSSSAPRITTAIVRVNGHPGAGIAISLAPGADALETAELVKARVEQLAASFPAGYQATPTPTTRPTSSSCRSSEVVKTLIEAIILVVLVMFVFLQSWRATLIPAIAVPVVLLGTFAVFYVAGFTINTLTLFGLVLAIGLLVDDAIVVVENVERLLDENPEHDAARGDDRVDERDPDRAGRHRAGAVGGVPADGVLRRLDRRHLPAVLDHDRRRRWCCRCSSR